MPFVAHFIDAFASILGQVLGLYTWVLIIRAVISWVNPTEQHAAYYAARAAGASASVARATRLQRVGRNA